VSYLIPPWRVVGLCGGLLLQPADSMTLSAPSSEQTWERKRPRFGRKEAGGTPFHTTQTKFFALPGAAVSTQARVRVWTQTGSRIQTRVAALRFFDAREFAGRRRACTFSWEVDQGGVPGRYCDVPMKQNSVHALAPRVSGTFLPPARNSRGQLKNRG
jgi:hypothetical protein